MPMFTQCFLFPLPTSADMLKTVGGEPLLIPRILTLLTEPGCLPGQEMDSRAERPREELGRMRCEARWNLVLFSVGSAGGGSTEIWPSPQISTPLGKAWSNGSFEGANFLGWVWQRSRAGQAGCLRSHQVQARLRALGRDRMLPADPQRFIPCQGSSTACLLHAKEVSGAWRTQSASGWGLELWFQDDWRDGTYGPISDT